jgi:hypothetical protein
MFISVKQNPDKESSKRTSNHRTPMIRVIKTPKTKIEKIF